MLLLTFLDFLSTSIHDDDHDQEDLQEKESESQNADMQKNYRNFIVVIYQEVVISTALNLECIITFVSPTHVLECQFG
jgi:high-affinity Fe2+/Pb2+ permease